MHKLLVALSVLMIISQNPLSAQQAVPRPQLPEGKLVSITIEVSNNMTQQAGAQAIKFMAKGSANHQYVVTKSSPNSITLRHDVKAIRFQFEGMGQKKAFDSDNSGDRQGQFGPLFSEILASKFELTVDSNGKTINAVPEKITLGKPDDRIVIITDMLKDLTQVIYPPQKGTGSFFDVLPSNQRNVGDKWTEKVDTENEKSSTENTISLLTDSTIVVDFKTTASSIIKSEIMGRETKTNVNTSTTGKIIIDRKTGIIREKTSVMDVNGTTEAMGGTVPITGKTYVNIIVR